MTIHIMFGDLSDHLTPGDRVVITDPRSAHHGKEGTITRRGELHGGHYILVDGLDGEVYFPWGYQRLEE